MIFLIINKPRKSICVKNDLLLREAHGCNINSEHILLHNQVFLQNAAAVTPILLFSVNIFEIALAKRMIQSLLP